MVFMVVCSSLGIGTTYHLWCPLCTESYFRWTLLRSVPSDAEVKVCGAYLHFPYTSLWHDGQAHLYYEFCPKKEMACLLMSGLARELFNFNSPNVPNGVTVSSTNCALLLHLSCAPSFESFCKFLVHCRLKASSPSSLCTVV